MKQFFTTILFLSIVHISSAQGVWFDLGANFAWGPTFIYNSDIFSDGMYDHEITTGNSFGAKIGVNFGENNGIHLVVNRTTMAQDFSYIDNSAIAFENFIEWKTTDLMLLYRYSGRGAYLEIGPKYSLVNEYSQEIRPGRINVDNVDFTEDYLSGVLGFGSYIAGTDELTISLGLRLAFAFTELYSDQAKTLNFPAFQYQNPIESSSLPFSAQINLEVNYAFGRLAKNSCAGRRKLMLFGR